MEPRNVVWIAESDLSKISMEIANYLEQDILTPQDRNDLKNAHKEIGVAKSRYETGPFGKKENLRLALGKNNGDIPLWFSPEEVIALLKLIRLPISLKDDLVKLT